MDLRRHMPWICWELLFSMLRMHYMHKGSSLNVDLMLSGNYVMTVIMLMFIYVYMYVCMYVCMLCLTGSWLFYANVYV